MNPSHPHYPPANPDVRRQEQTRVHALDIRANKFARDLHALLRTLVYTDLLARLRQNLTEPDRLVSHLDRTRRLANDAVRLAPPLRRSGVPGQSGKNPCRIERRRLIPVSCWSNVTFKVNVRRFKSPACTRPAPRASMVQMSPRAIFVSRY